jgi:hypothetical protein
MKQEMSYVDFVFSFHDLEHANNPVYSLSVFKKAVKENTGTIFYFSVPNIYKAFKAGDFTDIMYEHVSYFTLPSLRSLFNLSGYKILDIFEDTGGLYDSINVVASIDNEKKPSVLASKSDSDEIKVLAFSYAKKANTVVEQIQSQLTQLLDQGKRIVVWGAGARGVTLLNLLKDNRIKYVVDINPNKQGNFIPGTAQQIVSPSFLISYQPDYVFIINSIYKEEIKAKLWQMKVDSGILTIPILENVKSV